MSLQSVEASGSIEKAMDVLFHLHSVPSAQGVTAIGRALGLPKSSTHRLLTALGRRGLVERDTGGRYRPGFALVALGLGVLRGDPVAAAARPVLEESAEALAETFFLVGARAGRLVVLEKSEGSGFLRAAPRVGAEVPVHATAVGKLYLALGPELVASGDAVEAFTPKTLTRRADLERAAAEAGRRGWAANRDEWIPGLSVLAAPVLTPGPEPQLAGAVALAAATPRMREIERESGAQSVVEAAARVAERLAGG